MLNDSYFLYLKIIFFSSKMKGKMFVESLFSHRKIEQVMEPARFFLFISLNGYDVNGVAGVFDKFN